MSLSAIRLGLIEIGLGDGTVGEKISRAIVELVGQSIGVARFDVSGARGGIVRAGDGEQRLALVNDLAGRH